MQPASLGIQNTQLSSGALTGYEQSPWMAIVSCHAMSLQFTIFLLYIYIL